MPILIEEVVNGLPDCHWLADVSIQQLSRRVADGCPGNLSEMVTGQRGAAGGKS
jgi:hypothetical protein